MGASLGYVQVECKQVYIQPRGLWCLGRPGQTMGCQAGLFLLPQVTSKNLQLRS